MPEGNILSYAPTTFNPVLTLEGGAGNTVPVFTNNLGRYVRIGNICHVHVELTADGGAEGAGTGVLNVALPVAASASQLNIINPIGYGYNGTSQQQLFGSLGAGATKIALKSWSGAMGTLGDVIGNDYAMAGARTLYLNFSYEI